MCEARKQTSRIPGNLMSKFHRQKDQEQTGQVDDLIGSVERLIGTLNIGQGPRDVVLTGMGTDFRQTLVQTIETGI